MLCGDEILNFRTAKLVSMSSDQSTDYPSVAQLDGYQDAKVKYCCWCVEIDAVKKIFESRSCPFSADPRPKLLSVPNYRVSDTVSFDWDQELAFTEDS